MDIVPIDKSAAKLNINIRCIEIYKILQMKEEQAMLNINIRCIEMPKIEKVPEEYLS